MKTRMNKVSQAGLSLVETMIAMTLSAIVTVGVIQLFTANSEAYNLMQGQSRMQESARFGLDFIGRAVQQAGYKGCFSENEEVFTTLSNPNNIPYEFDLTRGLRGYEYMGSGWTPDPTADFADPFVSGNEINMGDILPRTDILTIRYTSQNSQRLSDNLLVDANDIPSGITFADTENDAGTRVWPGEFREGDLALIHDCEKATIFKVTDMSNDSAHTCPPHDPTATESCTLLAHAQGVDPDDNSIPGLTNLSVFEDDTEVSAIRTATFFIAPGAGVNNVGDTPLSLWRKFGTDAPVELVEGVENLQVLFGFDSDGDGTPNEYRTANLVNDADYTNVQTVRISITANSVDDVGATSDPTHGCIWDGGLQPCIDGVEPYDGLIRRTFTQTIQLRNKG